MTPQNALKKYDLKIDATFVPWSQSRNAEGNKSLNWRVALKHAGRTVLTTDYSAGIGHCPAYKLSIQKVGHANSIMRGECIDHEIETGKTARPSAGCTFSGPAIAPDTCDVMASLLLDTDAIDHSTFEDWAENFGYDTDSRKAESIYRTCLEHGLKLRAALGDPILRELREAFQDY